MSRKVAVVVPLGLVGLWVGTGASISEAYEHVSTANYAVYSAHGRIGDLQSIRRSDDIEGLLSIENRLRIEIDEFLWSYSLDGVETICIVNGEIERYETTFEEDGDKTTLHAFRATESQLVVSGTEPGEDETVKEIIEAEELGLLNEFAISSVIAERRADATMVVLDLDGLVTKEINYQYGGTTDVNAGGSSYTTHIVKFRAPSSQGTYWMVPEHGSYIPVLERGRDQYGEYRLEMQTLERGGTGPVGCRTQIDQR